MDISILRKLKIENNNNAVILNAPDEFAKILKNFKGSVTNKIKGKYSYIQVFITSQAEFVKLGELLSNSIDGDGLLWICYPKGTSKKYSKIDCNRDTLREAIISYGFEGVSMISLDDDWSAMRFRNSIFIGK
jgi:hypothetical protein